MFIITRLSYGRILSKSNKQSHLKLNDHLNKEDSALHEVAKDKMIYLLTNSKMGIIERSDIENFQFTKLVYSIVTTKTSDGYNITIDAMNKMSSLFYFTSSQIDEFIKIKGCNIEQKEYNYEYNIYYYIFK